MDFYNFHTQSSSQELSAVQNVLAHHHINQYCEFLTVIYCSFR